MANFDKWFNKVLCFSLLVVIILVAVLIITVCSSFKDGDPLKISLATACERDGQCRDPVALMEGEINARSESKTFDALKELLELHPEVSKVCLASNGGSVKSAVALGLLINRSGIDTCIAERYRRMDGSYREGLCQSSCVWVVISGRESVLYDGAALLGFHAARKDGFFDRGLDADGLKKFASLIRDTVKDAGRQDKLNELLKWSFDQGATSATTDCSAQQVMEYYPFFSQVKNTSKVGYKDCGLR